MNKRLKKIPLFKQLSRKYNKTISQIVLRWDLEKSVVTILKSAKLTIIKENLDIFNFQISAEDMKKLNN